MDRNTSAILCMLNSKYIHSALAPWCLVAGVKAYCDEGITAEVVEGTINEAVSDVAVRIAAYAPAVVGLCCYIWNIRQTLELIGLLKAQRPRLVVVLGGPEVSYNAQAVLAENPLVDYVISGEGEMPFALFLNAFHTNTSVEGIPGLCYRSGGGATVSEPYIGSEQPPCPYTPQYLQALKGRIAYLETSRGCPFSCAYCLSGRCGTVRFNDIERAKSEILLLASSGTQTVKLVDRTFNANRTRANALFDFIIRSYSEAIPTGVCFHFEIAGDILDDGTIDLLATASPGAIQLEIGLQTFNPKALEAIDRKTDINRLKSNISRLVQNGNMHIHIDLIAGLPFEDWDSFRGSFNTAFALKPHMLQLGFLKLLHGSPMREKPEDFPCEYRREPPYEVTHTPYLSADELARLHIIEDALERIYNSGRFPRTLEYILKQWEESPFELFCHFGVYAKSHGTHNISLDDYTKLIYEYFSGQANVDQLKLRDALVCDRLATDASGILPQLLRVQDPMLKRIKIELNTIVSTRKPDGVKRSIALLYSEDCAVYVDYENRNPITGEYLLHKYHYWEKRS